MILKFLLQITLTLFLVSIINWAFDELCLVGVTKIIEIYLNTESATDSVSSKLSLLNGRLISNLKSVTSYAQASVYVLAGLVLICYSNAVGFNTWRLVYNSNNKKSLFNIKNLYANAFLCGSILIDIILVALLVVMGKDSFQTYEKNQISYAELQEDLIKMNVFAKNGSHLELAALPAYDWLFGDNFNCTGLKFESFENFNRINQSIATLEGYYYTKYIRFVLSAVSFLAIAVLTGFFIILEIF